MIRKASRLTIVALPLMTLVGCYRYHLLAPEPDPIVTSCQRTVHALAWGLITHDTRTTHCEGAVPDSVASACRQSNAIDQVRVSSNFGFTLLTIVTLGFWSPMEMKWHCHRGAQSQPARGAALAPHHRGEQRAEHRRRHLHRHPWRRDRRRGDPGLRGRDPHHRGARPASLDRAGLVPGHDRRLRQAVRCRAVEG